MASRIPSKSDIHKSTLVPSANRGFRRGRRARIRRPPVRSGSPWLSGWSRSLLRLLIVRVELHQLLQRVRRPAYRARRVRAPKVESGAVQAVEVPAARGDGEVVRAERVEADAAFHCHFVAVFVVLCRNERVAVCDAADRVGWRWWRSAARAARRDATRWAQSHARRKCLERPLTSSRSSCSRGTFYQVPFLHRPHISRS